MLFPNTKPININTIQGVPSSRKINGKSLTSDIVLTGSDISDDTLTTTHKTITGAINGLEAGKEVLIAPKGDEPSDDAFYFNGRKQWDDIFVKVRETLLAGMDITNSSEVAEIDSVLAAIGKLQGQLNLKQSAQDEALETTSKQITEAINEINTCANALAVTKANELPASGEPLLSNTYYSALVLPSVYVFTPPLFGGWAHGTFYTPSVMNITFANPPLYLGDAPTFDPQARYEFDVIDNIWSIAKVVTDA